MRTLILRRSTRRQSLFSFCASGRRYGRSSASGLRLPGEAGRNGGIADSAVTAPKIPASSLGKGIINTGFVIQTNVTHDLLDNGDFENGLAGWMVDASSGYGPPSITTTAGEVMHGTKALKADCASYDVTVYQEFTARAGDSVYVECWMRCLSGTTDWGVLGVQCYTAAGE